MISYELAKQLKDAGFREKPWSICDYVYFRDVLTPFRAIKYSVYPNGEIVAYMVECVQIPTLSELIEACGEDFSHLARGQSFEALPWAAFDKDLVIYRGGSTPEEAVAQLWLALVRK